MSTISSDILIEILLFLERRFIEVKARFISRNFDFVITREMPATRPKLELSKFYIKGNYKTLILGCSKYSLSKITIFERGFERFINFIYVTDNFEFATRTPTNETLMEMYKHIILCSAKSWRRCMRLSVTFYSKFKCKLFKNFIWLNTENFSGKDIPEPPKKYFQRNHKKFGEKHKINLKRVFCKAGRGISYQEKKINLTNFFTLHI